MSKLKILAIHSYTGKRTGNPVDLWRIYRPLNELSKHVDWQIDHSASLIKQITKYKTLSQFTQEEVEKSAEEIGRYDAVFVSYWNMTAHMLAFMHVVEKRYGTKLIVDVDDDVFDIPYYNPIWLKVNTQEVEDYKQIVSIAPHVTTTNSHLAKKIASHNKTGRVFVLPNYISDDYKHEPIDNGQSIFIGYFGGSSHYRDLHRSGVFPALQKLMHENKNVRFTCVGQPVDYYLPRGRVNVVNAVNGVKWHDELFPTLNFDIAIAPLQDDAFAKGKSNIKWQESTRMGAAFIGSNAGPYRLLKKGTALLSPNTEEAWYIALKTLVDDKERRQKQLKAAQKELLNHRLEDHWQEYKTAFEDITRA